LRDGGGVALQGGSGLGQAPTSDFLGSLIDAPVWRCLQEGELLLHVSSIPAGVTVWAGEGRNSSENRSEVGKAAV